MSIANTPDVINCVAVLAGAGAMAATWRACRQLRSTTLSAPCRWALIALAAVTATVATSGLLPSAAIVHVQYLAGVATLAPFVALLGAKRPQNRAWQWIVAAFLMLLALQSIKALVIDRGAPPSLHLVWRWLLATVLLAEWINYLPTRNAIAATFSFAGQIWLLAEYLPLVSWPQEFRPAYGLCLVSAGVLGMALSAKLRALPPAPLETGDDGVAQLDRAWLNFRDAYGALWALRIAERINAACRQNDWPLRLTWRGFRGLDGHPANEVEVEEAVGGLFRSILARFVDVS